MLYDDVFDWLAKIGFSPQSSRVIVRAWPVTQVEPISSASRIPAGPNPGSPRLRVMVRNAGPLPGSPGCGAPGQSGMALGQKPPAMALVVRKGDRGGKVHQGSGDDEPGDDGQHKDQGISDDFGPGMAVQMSPEPAHGPGQLLGKQEEEQAEAGIEKEYLDHVIPITRVGKALGRRRRGARRGCTPADYLCVISIRYNLQARKKTTRAPRTKKG